MAEQTAVQDLAQPTDPLAAKARAESLSRWPSVATSGGGAYTPATLPPPAAAPVREAKSN